jgi:MFS family permease
MMTSVQTAPQRAHQARAPWRLPRLFAFYLQASIVVFLLAGSSAPTPLYSVYQSEWGFSPITTTIVFGVYALAVLASLLTVGSLSDHVGRRPVLLVALGVQALTMVVFATADGVSMLMLARVLQGLSTGAAIGAVGAGMIDLDQAKGTLANAVSAPIGTASGALGAGLFIQFLPDPTHLVFLTLAVVFVLQAVGVALMAESSSSRPGALASLRIRFALPPAVRRPMLLAAPALVAVWSLAGLYGALGPTLVRLMVGHNSFVLGGLSLFTLAGTGGAAVIALRHAAPRASMVLGASALIIGVALTVLAVHELSTALFFLGTAIAGVGFGAGFQATIRSVVPLAAPHERAGVLSVLYVVSYLAMGLPAVVAGVLVVYGGGVQSTATEYGAAVIVLAALALVGVLKPRRSASESSSSFGTDAPQAGQSSLAAAPRCGQPELAEARV